VSIKITFRQYYVAAGVFSLLFFAVACVKMQKVTPSYKYESYLYPYYSIDSTRDIVAEISLRLRGSSEFAWDSSIDPGAYIPPLKYNKTWLFLLSQDDCHHSTYSSTWALFNDRPLNYNFYYNAAQLAAWDLPPNSFLWPKDVGSTDGAGNDLRFSFTFTLYPEGEDMESRIDVMKNYNRDYYRFFKKSALVWDNVREMLVYDNGIAFHNVGVHSISVSNEDSIHDHMVVAQSIIRDKLNGRGCKVLAEPDGNKAYLRAGMKFSDIRIMTAQNDDAMFRAKEIYPFNDLEFTEKETMKRWFYDGGNERKLLSDIQQNLSLPFDQRRAIQVGVHGTGSIWIELFSEVSRMYGKGGDDSVWFTSIEEYMEYVYYRNNAKVEYLSVAPNELIVRLTIPRERDFWFSSLTLNIPGIKYEDIEDIDVCDAVKGLSFANYKTSYSGGVYEGSDPDGVMVNIDCSDLLIANAKHFTLKQSIEEEPELKEFYRNDALYFVAKLKNSRLKDSLLNLLR
jgi:hypothetical protein